MRVYLTGELAIEAGGRLLHEGHVPAPQARHLLAFLAAEHDRAIGHDEIAAEIWSGAPPASWTTSLKALVSRTRAALTAHGMDGAALLTGAPGIYRFRLPRGAWVDIDAARSAVHAAESLQATRESEDALREAFVARLITARPLLPGRAGPWLDRCRSQLRDLRLRALECSAHAHLQLGAPARAVIDAERAIEVVPLREPAWRLLIEAHAAGGDLASALLAYDRCRVALLQTLGVGPSAAMRERHAALLAHAG